MTTPSTIYLAMPAPTAAPPTPASPTRWRKQVLKIGEWQHPQDPTKKLAITPAMIAAMVRSFRAGVGGRVPLQDGHSEDVSDNLGDVTDLVPTSDGLDAIIDVHDPDTQKAIASGKLRDVSAGFTLDHTDARTGTQHGPVMRHVAAVMRPFLLGMRGFAPVTLADGSLCIPILLADPAVADPPVAAAPVDDLLLRNPGLTEADLPEVWRLAEVAAQRHRAQHPAGAEHHDDDGADEAVRAEVHARLSIDEQAVFEHTRDRLRARFPRASDDELKEIARLSERARRR